MLRAAIAARYGLNAARIVCGAGSDEILTLLAHAYLGPGDEAIFTEHGFLLYRIIVLSNGATPVVAPETNLRTDIGAILARVTERTKVVFLANPNNPTGTYVSIDEVREPARAAAVQRAAGARRRLRRIRAAQRLRGRHRARRNDAKHSDDAHVLQDPRAGRVAARVGLLPGGGRRRAEPHPRAVQRVRPGDGGGRRGDRRQGARGRLRRAQRALAAVARIGEWRSSD